MNKIFPLCLVKNKTEFDIALLNTKLTVASAVEEQVSFPLSERNDTIFYNGFCIPCNKNVAFLVDMMWGGVKGGGKWVPNWRERLVCPSCQMNNRQRLICALIEDEISNEESKSVYFMEQVTPIYNWAKHRFNKNLIIGSEYLGPQFLGAEELNGIRHEDIESLSFPDESLDVIISNDVFEHVPNPMVAFSECARVLKNGGVMIATIPFYSTFEKSRERAILEKGEIKLSMPAEYHGNPILAEGSLVFTDFGWDLLAKVKKCGFLEAVVEIYNSIDYAHLGGAQLVFRFSK